MKNQKGNATLSVLGVLFFLSCVAAWLTHIIFCLQEERWGFLIAGAIAFPIAIIHGWMIWFGIA